MNPRASGIASPPRAAVPPLESGDHLDQETFHRRYEAMPETVRAELIGGVVYMSSPAKITHGGDQAIVITWLGVYAAETAGTKVCDDTTDILGPYSQPQPDALLYILPERGGRTRVIDGYLAGPPELIAEIASSTESIDLHAKKGDYLHAGVPEYVVVALRQARVFWFVLREGHYEEHLPGPDGVYRSVGFPGLWLDAPALLREDIAGVLAVVRKGLASPEHAAFVQKLQNAGRA